jgi:hypothetical protein
MPDYFIALLRRLETVCGTSTPRMILPFYACGQRKTKLWLRQVLVQPVYNWFNSLLHWVHDCTKSWLLVFIERSDFIASPIVWSMWELILVEHCMLLIRRFFSPSSFTRHVTQHWTDTCALLYAIHYITVQTTYVKIRGEPERVCLCTQALLPYIVCLIKNS